MGSLTAILGAIALAGLPLFLVISAIAIYGFLTESLSISLYFAELVRLAETPTLVAIPLFTLAGYILAESNAANRLVRIARALLGWLPGGLAVVALAGMALFTAFSGASGVTIVAMGGLLFPALLKGRYEERFSLGLLTVSGSVGLLFPPSLPLIIYGLVANTPVDAMFKAGIIPGILMVVCLSLYSMYKGRNLYPRNEKSDKDKVIDEPLKPILKKAIWEIPLPIIILGGIYGGFFTATEAAIVTVVYLIIVECFIIRDIHPTRELPKVIVNSTVLIGGILLIMGSALALTNYLVYIDVHAGLLGWVKSVAHSKFQFLLMLNLFLLLIGCMMDIFSALVVVVPIILPVAISYGIDPVHLGIIFLTNLEIGYNTPPIGLNLFIASFRFERPIIELYRATLPFLIIQLIVLQIITYIPALSLFSVQVFAK